MEEASGPPVEVWPDNLLSVNVFVAMGTQWQAGMKGPVGLNYGALPTVMRFTGVPAKLRSEVFEDIRTMEGVALEKMREK